MSENSNGATVIMVIRHAEKPDTYNGQVYDGINATGTVSGNDAAVSVRDGSQRQE